MSDWKQYFIKSNRTLAAQAILNRILIETIAHETPINGNVLEIGCGTAYLSALLADMEFNVTAGDIDQEVIDYAQKKIVIPLNPVTFVMADLFRLTEQFEKNQFDTICHSGVMEHFSDDQIVMSLSQQRVVAKKIVFKIPNARTKMSSQHFGDERFMNNKKWVELIQNAGFQQVRVHGGESIPHWAYLFPAVMTLYPKRRAGSVRNQVFRILAYWRRWVSKHSIFVCEG